MWVVHGKTSTIDSFGGGGECVGAMGEYTSTEWTEAEKEIESPPRLGLGTVNITSFVE